MKLCDKGGYEIHVPTSGGKAGTGHNLTSTIQVRHDGLIVKQIRFSMTAESSRRKAVQKAKDWIDKNPLQPKFPAIDPEQPAFIRVPVKAISVITAALEAVGMKKEANEVEAFARDYTDPEANANRESWLAEANGMARDGEIEFDSDSTISHSEGGEYVLGWVWVKGDEEEDEDEENDE